MESTRLVLLNASIAVLLLLFLGGALLLPLFDRSELLQRQEEVERRLDSLKQDEDSATDEFVRRTAAVDERLAGLQAELAVLQEPLSILSARVAVLDGNDAVAGFTDVSGAETPRNTSGSSDRASGGEENDPHGVSAAVELFTDSFSMPISLEGLPSEFRAKLDHLPGGYEVDNLSEEEFLAALIKGQLLSYSSVDSIPGSLRQELHALFVRYQTMLRILTLTQDREVNRLVVQANRDDHFLEWPIESQEPPPSEKELTGGESSPGITITKRIREHGVQRLYRFTYEDFDQIRREKPMENVKRHVFRDLYFLTEAGVGTPSDGS